MIARTKNVRGFTLVELIMAIAIIGILAVFVAPRFYDVKVYQSRGFADQVQASLRYAQKIAIAQHRNVCVAFTSSSVTLNIASISGPESACDRDLVSPFGDASYVINAPSGITFAATPTNFSFNALGKPSIATQTISINGAANSITVEAETGYVHQ